ncbi:hypothetical protein N9W57_03705 [Pseudomonadales bacterium]|nr:hypothetical protein [Pseudomonadales bacterium]
MRYKNQSNVKKTGETFTPLELADFVAAKILQRYSCDKNNIIRILEPSVGDGELINE